MADEGGGADDAFIYMGGNQRVPYHITHAIVDRSVDTIRREAFRNRRRLVSIEMHDGVKLIEERTFEGCWSLRKIKLSGVELIGMNAFFDCSSLEDVEFGNKLDTIEGQAFFCCTSLRSAKLPKVRVIEDRAFSECNQLTEAELSEDLQSVGDLAFCDCYDLRRIAIPLKEDLIIEDYAFGWCGYLSQVGVVGEIHNTISSLFLDSWKSDMYDEIDSINQVLPNTDLNKTTVIQDWMRRVLDKIRYYTSEHYALLKDNMTQLELALWKANLPSVDAAARRHDAHVTCGANIIIPHVLSFLNDHDAFPLLHCDLATLSD